MAGEGGELVRSAVSEKIEENTDFTIGGVNVAGLLYNTVMSGADSLLASAVGTPWVGATILASNAAQSTARDIHERGGSDGQALIGGLMAGVFESLFERVSLGNLQALRQAKRGGLKNFTKNTLKSMGVNASEEMATELANIVYDTVANGDLSKWERSIEYYISEGLTESEAKSRTVGDMFRQIMEAGASGSLMGAGFSAGTGLRNAVKGNQQGKVVQQETQSNARETVGEQNLDKTGRNNIIEEGNEERPEPRKHLTPPTEVVRQTLEAEGLDQSKINEIVALPKKEKTSPQRYLSRSYIKKHLDTFRKTGVFKILPSKPEGTIGSKNGIFVTAGTDLNLVMAAANGNVREVECLLGLSPGYLGDNPYIVEIVNYSGLRIPSGREPGADADAWIPGGFTFGGIREAVIDMAPEGTYTYRRMFE